MSCLQTMVLYIKDILPSSHSQCIKTCFSRYTTTILVLNPIFAWPIMFYFGLVFGKISGICATCVQTARYQNTAPQEPMKSLPVPNLPWQIISQDLFEYKQQSYLVTVCHFTDWIEVDQLPDTLSSTVIQCTKAHFARFGIPEILHFDNGSQ